MPSFSGLRIRAGREPFAEVPRVATRHITRRGHAARDAGPTRAELPREEGPPGPCGPPHGLAGGDPGRREVPRARGGHERRVVAPGEGPRVYEGARRQDVPTHPPP